MFHTGNTHTHKQPNSHSNLGLVDPFFLLLFLTWARHQSVCRGGNRGLHYLNPTHLYFIVGRHKRAVCWHMKGWISTWIIFRLKRSRHCMCNVMLMPAYPLCWGSLGGKDMARLNEFGGDDTEPKVKSGKICVLGRMINYTRDLNMEHLVLVSICSYGIKPEDK